MARRQEGTETTYVRNVRVGRHQTFDRVVFEFSGSMPNYQVEYLRGRFYENEGGRQRIKIAGNAFIQVNLNLIPTDEEQMRLREQDSFIPKGRQSFVRSGSWMRPDSLKAIMISCWASGLASRFA